MSTALPKRLFDLVEALQPARIGLERFIEGWYSDDTQAALRALMARLGK